VRLGSDLQLFLHSVFLILYSLFLFPIPPLPNIAYPTSQPTVPRFQKGNPEQFSIECTIPEVQPGMDFADPSLKLLGYIRFWAAGEVIGDFHRLYYLSAPYLAFIELRPMRNQLHDPALGRMSAEEINEHFDAHLYAGEPEAVTTIQERDSLRRHELTGRFGLPFDDFYIRILECRTHDRLVWYDALTEMSYEALLPRGMFFSVAEEFIAWYISVVVEFKTAARRLKVR
jgi:hypothetical protein